MSKFLNKIIHKLFDRLGYKIIKKEDVINFKVDNFKIKLNEKNKNDFSLEELLVFFFKNYEKSNSQLFQDLFVDKILNKNDGVYCEVGALDGVTQSNSYYLEKELGWKGILCEPNKKYLQQLKKNRPNNIIILDPIYSENNKTVDFYEFDGGRSGIYDKNMGVANYKLNTITLNKVFEKNLVDNKIDYLSIDTEGTEFEIIKGINFEIYKPEIITIEHNYNIKKRNKIYKFLREKNYNRVFKSISRFDDWYIRVKS